MNAVPAEQYRIEQVQILNWGGYADLQVMRTGRTSTAVLGPSGRGKSTLLDAMASVIMPNPQEFNQAARDDKGGKRERTVYTYARGLTASHQDDNGRSATASYLRPPGAAAFISGAAITWSTGVGKRVTAFRLAWVGTDATDNASIGNSTVYGFVHDAFDLARLDGLKPIRSGAAPLSEASMRHLIDPARGDLVDHRQPRMHAAMRRALQMGHTEESQRLAMYLLRRAQASKGIFSINDLFKDFVLTEPRALARWDVTLEHYREASRLYDEFELAKTKTETLKELPVVAEQYRSAGRDATDRRALAQPPASGVARLQVWHSSKTLDWAYTYEEDVRLELAQAKEDLQGAQTRTREAEDTERDALNALTASGADQTILIRERIERAQEKQRDIQAHRATMTARLKTFDQVLPSSSGDLELLRVALAQQAAEHADHRDQLSQNHETQAGEKTRLGTAIPQLTAELERVSKQAGNIPHEADQRRQLIADGARIAVGRLQYIGELLDIPPEHCGWERAILTIIRPLASDLLVAAEDFPAVRAWVNSHNLGGDTALVPGVAHRPVRTHQAGTVAAMLDITADPYQGWLSEELQRFTYLCVEKDTDLEGPRPDGVIGRVTRAGLRTAPNRRVIKADTPRRYRWVGRDNSALRAELDDDLAGLQRQFDDISRRVEIARGTTRTGQARIGELEQIQKDLSWTDLDLEPTTRRLATLADALDRVDTPEQQVRRDAYKLARQQVTGAEGAATKCQDRVQHLNLLWGAVQRAQDSANDVIDAHDPLTADEQA
ncbi:MAG TPA: ATP-binding protein, partial [Streptosporangiaceae bacterium]|nr:ATP-binding protein [Streptosporangiaceae bacterium]